MSTQKVLLGALAGLAAGAAIGILFAPQSGKRTRKLLLQRKDEAHEDLNDFIQEGRKAWNKAKGRAANAATMTKEEVEDFVKYMMDEGKDLKDRVTDDVKRTAQDVAQNGKRTTDDLRKAATN